MKVAGLQNLSLVDYPGHLAAAIFLQGCNFRCPYCHNPALISPDKKFECTELNILDYITQRKDLLEGVVISGGEPTLHKDLPEFAAKIKGLGLKVKIDTNGTNPGLLEQMLRDRLIDYIALDIKTSLDKYSLVAGGEDVGKVVHKSILLTMLTTVPYEFRTTCVPGIVAEEDFHKIGEVVRGAKKYCLQQFRPSVTLDPAYHDIKPYTKTELEKFLAILEEYVADVEIRGL